MAAILSRSHDHLPLTYPPYISHCNYSGHSVHSRTSFSLRQRHSCISQPCLVTFLTARDKHKTCYTSYHVKKSTHLTTKGHFSGSHAGIIILVPYHFNQATVTNLKIGCQIASRCNLLVPTPYMNDSDLSIRRGYQQISSSMAARITHAPLVALTPMN